jgi:N-acetylmuramoyl-L-alanine amidase
MLKYIVFFINFITTMKYAYLFVILFFSNSLLAQQATLNIESPGGATNKVTAAKQFITGTTCTNCTITINDTDVKVYKTGVFVYQMELPLGLSSFLVVADNGRKTIERKIDFIYELPKPIKVTDSFYIEQINIDPSGDVALQAGEYLAIKVKTKPGCKLVMNNKITIPEIASSQTKGIAGYYQLNYKVKESDSFLLRNLKFGLYKNGILKTERTDKNVYTLFKDETPTIAKTNNAHTPIYSGLGEDRLGGTKAGFLDSSVMLHIVSRYNNLFKVKLNNSLSVYVPKDYVNILPEGNIIPKSLTSNIGVTGDSVYDYVRIDMGARLPYLSTQQTKPNKIIVDIYGATSNSNWLIQYPETLQEVEDVNITQVNDGQLRATIDLKHKQLWGYKTYYEGNALVIKIRRQKESLSLKSIVIGLDAGHGGSNDGARGIAGRYEKEFTLLISKEIKKIIEAKGGKVIMSRESDISYENNERLKMYRNKMPDLAISIHLNSAGDPLRVKGASTYYKYAAYRGLSQSIYNRLKETGLKGWGNIGNFNFFLNSAIEFPTALVECLFVSNPEDEEKVHDEAFRKNLAEKIVQGIEDWLQQCEKDKVGN